MPPRSQLGPKLDVVEDLAVERDPQRAVLVGHRLMAAADIDDAESGVAERTRPVQVHTLGVGPAVRQRAGHPFDQLRRRWRAIEIYDSGYPTHT